MEVGILRLRERIRARSAQDDKSSWRMTHINASHDISIRRMTHQFVTFHINSAVDASNLRTTDRELVIEMDGKLF